MFSNDFNVQTRIVRHMSRLSLVLIAFGFGACVTSAPMVEREEEIDDVFYGDITEGLDAPLWDDEGFGFNPNNPIDKALSESPNDDREDWLEPPAKATQAAAKTSPRKTKPASKKSGGGR